MDFGQRIDGSWKLETDLSHPNPQPKNLHISNKKIEIKQYHRGSNEKRVYDHHNTEEGIKSTVSNNDGSKWLFLLRIPTCPGSVLVSCEKCICILTEARPSPQLLGG